MSFLFPDSSRYDYRTGYTATNTTTVSSTSETSLLSSGQGLRIIPANFWSQQGRTARLIMRGVSSTTLIPGNATFKIKLGGTTIITGTTGGLLGSLSNSNFYLSLTIACLNPGVTGAVVCSGEIDYVSGVNALKSAIPLNLASTAVDTTSDQSLDVSVTWGLSGNSITILTATLELLPMV